jgi:hypothetical protein
MIAAPCGDLPRRYTGAPGCVSSSFPGENCRLGVAITTVEDGPESRCKSYKVRGFTVERPRNAFTKQSWLQLARTRSSRTAPWLIAAPHPAAAIAAPKRGDSVRRPQLAGRHYGPASLAAAAYCKP